MSNDVDRTLWVGNLSDKVTDEILYELFLQAGPLERVSIAKERDTGKQKSFAFVTFVHDVSVPYTIKLMDGLQLFGRNLRLQTRPGSIHQQQQQQQQQQLQQNMNQGSFRNFNNPYQNNQIISSPQPYQNNQYMQMNTVPPNPFSVNQPMRNQHQRSGMQHPPSFQKSQSWHGNDLSVQHERDRDERRGHDRDRHSNRDRDRSNSRRRDCNSENNGRDEHRDSPVSYNRNANNGNSENRHSESIESRRQKVLQKQDRMLQSYRREKDARPSPPYHNHRRGRY